MGLKVLSSLVPIPIRGCDASGYWAPEPVFTLDECAKILGVSVAYLKVHAHNPRYEVQMPKGISVLKSSFEPHVSEFGEVTITVESPGGPVQLACLTHFGLFRHAVFITTRQARHFTLHYPDFVLGLKSGRIRPPLVIAEVFQRFLSAPAGTKERRRAKEEGMRLTRLPQRTFYHHANRIARGFVGTNGLVSRGPRSDRGSTKFPVERAKFLALVKAFPGMKIAEAARRFGLPLTAARLAVKRLFSVVNQPRSEGFARTSAPIRSRS